MILHGSRFRAAPEHTPSLILSSAIRTGDRLFLSGVLGSTER
jgi:hypothetical protein